MVIKGPCTYVYVTVFRYVNGRFHEVPRRCLWLQQDLLPSVPPFTWVRSAAASWSPSQLRGATSVNHQRLSDSIDICRSHAAVIGPKKKRPRRQVIELR